MIHVCENQGRILCHASLLKCDDVCLKNLPLGNKVWSLCNLYSVKDASHIIMQCPGTQQLCNNMFDELESHQDIKEMYVDYKQQGCHADLSRKMP